MKAPQKSRVFMIAAVVVVFAGISSFLVWNDAPLDLSKEEAPFPSIAMPPQAVYGIGYMSGSVGILIIDHLGTRHELTFPIDHYGIRNGYPTAFVGNMNDPKKVPLKDPERAKQIVIRLIDGYGKEMVHPSVDCNDLTARIRSALASPPVAHRAFDKIRRTFGY